MLIPAARVATAAQKLDVAGAVTVTSALMLAVYAIVNGNEAGWSTAQTLGLLAVSGVLLVALPGDRVEGRVAARAAALFRLRNIAVSNVVGVLWAARCSRGSSSPRSTCSWCSGTRRSQVGLAFLPGNLIMGALSMASRPSS